MEAQQKTEWRTKRRTWGVIERFYFQYWSPRKYNILYNIYTSYYFMLLRLNDIASQWVNEWVSWPASGWGKGWLMIEVWYASKESGWGRREERGGKENFLITLLKLFQNTKLILKSDRYSIESRETKIDWRFFRQRIR